MPRKKANPVRKLRRKLKITQAELARELQVSSRTVGRWEHGWTCHWVYFDKLMDMVEAKRGQARQSNR